MVRLIFPRSVELSDFWKNQLDYYDTVERADVWKLMLTHSGTVGLAYVLKGLV